MMRSMKGTCSTSGTPRPGESSLGGATICAMSPPAMSISVLNSRSSSLPTTGSARRRVPCSQVETTPAWPAAVICRRSAVCSWSWLFFAAMVSAGTSTAASAMTTRTAAPHARSRSRRPGSGRSLGIEKSSGSLAALLRFVISLSLRSAPSGGLEGCGGILAIEVRPARRLVHRVLGHVVAVLLVREDQVREAVEDQDVAERIDSEDSMADAADAVHQDDRSEEHTYELQSLMRNSYAVFCLKKKKI